MNVMISSYHAGRDAYEVVASLLYSGLRFRRRALIAFARGGETWSRSLVIAMNGPTLVADLERIAARRGSTVAMDHAVANHFADTDFFVTLKPRHYFFSDPYFWDGGTAPDLIVKRRKTFDTIAATTDWPLRVYFSVHADPAPFEEAFGRNENIRLCPFNGAALPTRYNALLAGLWRRNICAPFGQNVLIHVVYAAVQLGYCDVAIAGAGFSFHEQIHVDQQDNTFYKRRRHVYGETLERGFVDQRKTVPAQVSTEFLALYNSFRSLEAVAKYAETEGVTVTNYSKYSYLDMFDRPSPAVAEGVE